MQEASSRASTRKQAAISFLKLAASGDVSEAYGKYISPNFRHHNPYFRGDAQSLKAGMEENAAKFPNKVFEVKHVLDDGDLVAVHSRVQLDPEMPELALVHIFRFEDGRIAELWDVAQTAPDDLPNENGMF